ncbi:MAG: glycosyltransferase family 4 protein [Synergistaceae bacterium]|jgi:glycosyltransferase involved in cell wall biosynthesis|nr:glycosyltransferase family 4 protein [Synergistaceae bacterium]
MKVLHVLQGTVGGTVEFINLLTQQLNKRGYINIVASPRYSNLRDKCLAQGMDWLELDMCREISLIKDTKSILKLIKIIKDEKCDILHAHSSKAGAIGRVAAWLSGIPCIYTPHGWSFNMKVSNLKKMFYRVIERLLAHITSVITCISQHELESAISAGISPKMLTKIDNGMNLAKYDIKMSRDVLRGRLNIPEDKIVIGMVARITEQKDPFFFLDIASEMRSRVKDSYFILVGDGDLREQFEERIASSEDLRDRVLVIGWVDEPELYIKCFDVAILTSKWEGFGLVLVEYMASKIPIVATNVDGIPYVIRDGYSGLLAESGNVVQFSDKICKLLHDKSLADILVSNGYKAAHGKFSIQRTAEMYDQVYRKIQKK